MKTKIEITVPADILTDLLVFMSLPEKDQDAVLELMETTFEDSGKN